MKRYEKKALKLELERGTPCELKHKGFTRATNYITCDIGFNGEVKYCFTIPICQECENTLVLPEWILIFCLKCSRNQWVYKPLGRLDYYNKHILWTSCCPYCQEENEQVQIFFND